LQWWRYGKQAQVAALATRLHINARRQIVGIASFGNEESSLGHQTADTLEIDTIAGERHTLDNKRGVDQSYYSFRVRNRRRAYSWNVDLPRWVGRGVHETPQVDFARQRNSMNPVSAIPIHTPQTTS
jgi:hypothetical protein